MAAMDGDWWVFMLQFGVGNAVVMFGCVVFLCKFGRSVKRIQKDCSTHLDYATGWDVKLAESWLNPLVFGVIARQLGLPVEDVVPYYTSSNEVRMAQIKEIFQPSPLLDKYLERTKFGTVGYAFKEPANCKMSENTTKSIIATTSTPAASSAASGKKKTKSLRK